MKKIKLISMLMLACALSANAGPTYEQIIRYYGEKVNENGKIPCQGKTKRVCAEVIVKVEYPDSDPIPTPTPQPPYQFTSLLPSSSVVLTETLVDAEGNVLNVGSTVEYGEAADVLNDAILKHVSNGGVPE